LPTKPSGKKKRGKSSSASNTPPNLSTRPKKATVYLTAEQNLALEKIRLSYLEKHHQRLDKQDLIKHGIDLVIAKYQQEPPQPPAFVE
jgi:hypothetical protein